jgi:hypothetical protein
VNHSTGDNDNAINSGLVQTIKGAFGSHSSGVFVYAGQSISDSQHLRRSPVFVCNSPIVICYLFGTNNVTYN